MISVDTLRAQVRSTAPFLFPAPAPAAAVPPDATSAAGRAALAGSAQGFLALVRGSGPMPGEAYFALCCASHHATVATYVPTDVDSKIRGALWRASLGPALRAERVAFVLQARHWSTQGISARVVGDGAEAVSGHHGEWLSVLLAGLAHCVLAQDQASIGLLDAAIEQELWREARCFLALWRVAGAETTCQGLAAILTHNAGDVDQALSYWPSHGHLQPYRARFARLAHDHATAFSGAFLHAARIYKATLAPEGHRNYPLRAVKALRTHPDLLLPISPFLEPWGGTIASHPALTEADRLAAASALIDGCERVRGQRGYQRALCGMLARWPGGADALVTRLAPATRQRFEAAELQRQLAVPQAVFAAQMRDRYLAARDA